MESGLQTHVQDKDKLDKFTFLLSIILSSF